MKNNERRIIVVDRVDGGDIQNFTETDALEEALDAVLEFWNNGTAVHADSLVAEELTKAVANSRLK